MTETPGSVIETPPMTAPTPTTDLLADVLKHVRLSGALFLRGEYTAPWSFDSPGACGLVELLSPGAERLIVFHTVSEGHAFVDAAGHRVEIHPGDFAILPASHHHIIGSAMDAEAVPIAKLLPPAPWSGVPVLRHGGGGALTNMICGYFRCDELLFNSFLRSLPPVMVVRPQGAAGRLMEAALSYALENGELGIGEAMPRVPELLLVEALRLYSEQAPAVTGWLAATNDPVVSRALRLLHGDPARNWSVDDLAREAATSRSVLGERFRLVLGQSPIHYLIEWRMQLAADLLRTTEIKLAEVAERAGYGSEAAFSRAFHRHLGQSPAQWRESAAGTA